MIDKLIENFMKYQILKSISFAILSSLALPVVAQGIVLNNEDLRTDLNWLNQQGVIQIVHQLGL